MEIRLSNQIEIKNAPTQLKQLLQENLKVANPKYNEAVKAGRSTYGIQRTIYNFEILPTGNLLVPRGVRKQIIRLARKYNVYDDLKVVDNRSFLGIDKDIDSSIIRYRPYQYNAVLNLTSAGEEGILVAPPGSGKTVVGLSLIPLLSQPTLWLTHTHRLAQQALDRVKHFLPNLGGDEVGYIGSGKWSPGSILTIALIQTLIRNPERLSEMANDFGLVIMDECLVGGSQILMLDGSIKDITQIRNGEVTPFGCISNKFEKETDTIINLRGGWGEIEGTPTHVLPFVPKNSLKLDKHTNCFFLPKEDDVVFEPMHKIKPADFLLVKEEVCHVEKHKVGKRKSRLLALIACDGHIEKHLYCIQVGVTKDKEWFLEEMYTNTSFVNDPDIKESSCKRGDLIIRCYSKDIIEFLNTFIAAGKKHTLYTPSIMEHASLSDIREYLQVVFDCEGGTNDNQITITMSTPEFLHNVQHLLQKFGILARMIPIKRRGTRKAYMRLALSGYDAFLFHKKIGFSMKRKQEQLSSIVKKSNKFVRYIEYRNVRYRCMPIVAKTTKKGTYVVYDFTTEEHLFIANGVLSSNCHHAPASTFSEVVKHLNPYYLYGLTATPYRRDGLEELMFQAIGEVGYTIELKEVSDHGSVMLPKVIYKTIHSQPAINNNVAQLLKRLINDDVRNQILVSDILQEAHAGNFCIVISDRKAHCETLFELISLGWEKTGIATGDYSKKYVDEQVKRFETGDMTVLCTTFALLGEGFDVPFLNRAFITTPFRSEAKVEQLVGRIQRTAKNKHDAIVYDYVDADIGIFKNQFYSPTGSCRHKVYTRLGLDIEPG